MLKDPDSMWDFSKRLRFSAWTKRTLGSRRPAFISVVTVPSVLAQAGMRSARKHFSSRLKLLRELKFCRSITSGRCQRCRLITGGGSIGQECNRSRLFYFLSNT